MSILDRWLRRTDDARRMKGDPPPTVDQLLVTVRQQGEIMRNLRYQCDGLIAENARLRGEGICGDEAPTLNGLGDTGAVCCTLRHGHASEWHQADTGMRWTGIWRKRGDQAPPLAVDPVVTRPYIPDYGVPATEDPTVLDYDPWKDETR